MARTILPMRGVESVIGSMSPTIVEKIVIVRVRRGRRRRRRRVTFVVVCRGGRGGERVDAADSAADGVVIVSDATMQQRTRLRGELNVAQLRLAQRGKH